MEFAQQKHKNHDCDNSLSYYEFGNLKKTLKHFIKFETAFVALKKNVQQTQTTFKSTCTLKHYFRVHFIQTFYSNILFKHFIQTIIQTLLNSKLRIWDQKFHCSIHQKQNSIRAVSDLKRNIGGFALLTELNEFKAIS